MPVFQQGALNTTALIVPDLYVQIVPPQSLLLNGVPTDVLGIVGTASWGPVGEPVIVGSMGDYAASFGAVMARKYDMGTQVATAVQQGAGNFRCVRVTDGTDTAAALPLLNGVTFTAIYTGSLGNALAVTLSAGSAANSWRVVISLPGLSPEIFDNILGTGAVFWENLVNAVNNGNGVLRGPSQLVVAVGGAMTADPVAGTFAFASGMPGTDGASAITAGTLVGVDTLPRQGMYGLRSQGCAVALLADADDATQWSVQTEFGLSEGVYMILTGPVGDNIANAVAIKAGAGIDVIANPQPGGNFWGVRGGHNSSSNAATNGDNYTRLTNYIAYTLSAGMGAYVGQLVNTTLFQNIRGTLLAFLNGLLSQGMLGGTDGSLPFAVVCDVTNNPQGRTALGYVQADVQVRYQAINEKFIVNVQGGQTVQVSVQTLPANS
jgi:phage tail sheath protein FI